MNIEEIWKDIPDYEGYYQASTYGRIRSMNRVVIIERKGRCFEKNLKGHILNLGKDKDGYATCPLSINGKRKTCKVHRLVALTFLLNPENKEQVNHKSGIKSQNNIENLEWVNPQENAIHSFRVLKNKSRDLIVIQYDLNGSFIK